MGVKGSRQSKQRLQNALDMGGRQEVVAAGHEGDTLIGIVDDHGDMIGRGRFLAGENDVAELQRIDENGRKFRAFAPFMETECGQAR